LIVFVFLSTVDLSLVSGCKNNNYLSLVLLGTLNQDMAFKEMTLFPIQSRKQGHQAMEINSDTQRVREKRAWI
jgi:hypothetical protein